MKAKPISPKGQKKDKLQPRRNRAACADSPREPYRTIFENTGNATILIAPDTTIILANSNFADLVGYPREEMEGKMSWTSLIAPEELPKMRHYHERRRQPGGTAPSTYEFGLLTRSGERRDMLITVALIPGTGESVATCMDITDRKRVEKELLQSRENLLKQQAFNQLLLEEKFDHIFFTGSVKVGKIVMESASRQLTPVTLELGGKSPCVVNKDADIKKAAARIVWGKTVNCGQTCIAPDYVLVHEDIKDKLIQEMAKAKKKYFGEDMLESPDYGKIIRLQAFNELLELVNGQKVLEGGRYNAITQKIESICLLTEKCIISVSFT